MAGEWPRVALSQVVTPVIGGTPSRAVTEYWNGDIPWATAKDVARVKGRYLESVEEFITREGLENSAAKLLPKGTVLITARGTVGEVAQLGRNMAFNQTCYALLPSEKVDNDFLFYALKGTLAEMKALTYGTVFETITTSTFAHWSIPLPPLPEQRAIAHILGALDDKIELNRWMSETLEQMALQYPVKYSRITRGKAAELFRIGPYQPSRVLVPPVTDGMLPRHNTPKGARCLSARRKHLWSRSHMRSAWKSTSPVQTHCRRSYVIYACGVSSVQLA